MQYRQGQSWQAAAIESVRREGKQECRLAARGWSLPNVEYFQEGMLNFLPQNGRRQVLLPPSAIASVDSSGCSVPTGCPPSPKKSVELELAGNGQPGEEKAEPPYGCQNDGLYSGLPAILCQQHGGMLQGRD